MMNLDVQYYRIMAILAVMSRHVTLDFLKIGQVNLLCISLIWVSLLLKFGVPMFVCISGFLLASKYYENLPLREFYRKRFFKVVFPYVVFSIIYIILFVADGHYSFSLISAFRKIFTGNASEHLWFIRAIVELYLLFPLNLALFKLGERREKTILLLSIAFIFQLACRTGFGLFFSFGEFYLYFLIGIYWSRNPGFKTDVQRLINSWWCWGLFFACVFVNVQTVLMGQLLGDYRQLPDVCFIPWRLSEPYVFLFSFSIIFWVVNHLKRLSEAVSILAPLVFGVYLIHIIFIAINVRGLRVFGITHEIWVYYPFVYVATVIQSFAVIYLLSQSTYTRPLIGLSPKRKEIP